MIRAEKLESFAANLLAAGGFVPEEAKAAARSLVLANLCGHDSHGVVQIPGYIEDLKAGEFSTGLPPAILSETPAMISIDAKKALGLARMPDFADRLVAKAKASGAATGVLRNGGHVGRLGEWTERVAEQGCAALMLVNDNGHFLHVAPPGAREGRTSTNPVAFGIPLKGGEVFSADFSTSSTALGKLRLARLAGTKVREGLVQDASGAPSTDPAAVLQGGTLLPMGGADGYKGFALSMMVDCLVAGLSGGFAPPAPEGEGTANNVLLAVWDPVRFSGLAHMHAEAEKYLRYVAAAAPSDPARPVRLPGARAKGERARREAEGIPLNPGVSALLGQEAAKWGIDVPGELAQKD